MRQLPWRAAPRAALSSPLTMVVAAITALLSCFLATAAVLHSSAAGGAALDHQADTVCPDSYGPVFSRSQLPAELAPALSSTVQRHAAQHGFGQAVLGLYSRVMYGSQFDGTDIFRIRLAYRGDPGLDHLELVRGARQPGVWMGNDLASIKRFEVGSQGSVNGAPLPVTGVYRDLYDPPARWWCSQQDMAVQNRLIDTETGSVLFATDRETFDRAVNTIEVPPGQSGRPALDRLSITFYEPPPGSLAEAKDRAQRSAALIADVQADLAAQGLPDSVTGAIPFQRSVEIAQQAQGNVLFSILPLAAISVLVGCAGIGTVALQWYQRRYAQVRLLSARGTGPAGLGWLAVLELGLPVLLGGVAGMALARMLLGVYGPGGVVDDGAPLLGTMAGGGVLLLSLVLLGSVVAVRAHREFQLGRGRRRRKGWRLVGAFPWELVTAGIAAFGWSRLATGGGSARLGSPLPQVDPVALTYPVFVVLTAGLLTARLVWLLLHASHRVQFWSRPPLQLAIRRLAGSRAPVTGVLVIGVLAIGTLAAGSGIAGGQRAALDGKSGIFVGANTRVDTENSLGTGTIGMPAEIRDSSTVVGELTGTGSVVLVVDPATFTDVAWLGDLPRERAAELVHRLDTPVPGAIPALRIGHTAAQSPALPRLPDASPVADLPLFPMIGTKPGYVISRNALTPEQLTAVPRWSVLSGSSVEQVADALGKAGLVQPNKVSKASALDALPFFVVEWTFSFVIVLGAVLGVVAVLALLVAVEVRRRQNALAGALVLRMGMRPRALLGSHLIELGALAGLAVLAGVGCGVVTAGISVPRFDPATWLAPRSDLPNPAVFVLSVVLTGIVVVGLAGWLAVRSVRTARTAELLRG
ncbi:permease [Amycolatopsis nigrescens]|uniref:permease n=1 Tax=Amycolatopsis nigrescens TaxID=381445 RepID=UPI0003A68E5C|nr:permease [Amycolatopsis nigrescens]